MASEPLAVRTLKDQAAVAKVGDLDVQPSVPVGVAHRRTMCSDILAIIAIRYMSCPEHEVFVNTPFRVMLK